MDKLTMRQCRMLICKSQKQIAELMNLSVGAYINKENGKSKMYLDEAILFGKITHKSIDQIFWEKQNEKND